MQELIQELPLWSKIFLILGLVYLVTWFPRIIGAFNIVIRKMDKTIEYLKSIEAKLDESLKQERSARVTADLFSKMLDLNKEKEKKEL